MESKNNDNEIKKENSLKDKCLKYTSANYLWYPLIMLLVTVVIIFCLVESQNKSTKEYVKSIINVIKQDTTKYKLDSLTNHRLITLEINQNSYSNNIDFYSIFIAAIITIVILIIGFAVYLNNKENVKKLEKEQKKLDVGIESMKTEQIAFKNYINGIKVQMTQIVDDQEYFQSEIFLSLTVFSIKQYFECNKNNETYNSFIFIFKSMKYCQFCLTNAHELSTKHEINIWEKNIFEILNQILDDKQTMDIYYSLKSNKKNNLISYLTGSLKFIDENKKDTKSKIEDIIKRFQTYKTKD